MEELKEKLINEDNDLFTKLYSLKQFIKSSYFQTIPIEHRHLLQIQFNTMHAYHDILRARISLLNQSTGDYKVKKLETTISREELEGAFKYLNKK